MRNPLNDNRKELMSEFFLMALAAVVAWLSAGVLWLGDDVDYGFFIVDSIWNSHGSIDSVAEFFQSQANHYINVNGRFVAHALVQLFCAVLGQKVFAVCNGLVYCLFVMLLLKVAGVGLRRQMRSPAAVAAVCALVLLVFVTKMMPTTQIGFVWMLTLTLLWILALRRYAGRPGTPVWLTVLLFAGALVAGNGQEALNAGVATVTVAWAVWRLWRHRRISAAGWALLAGFWLGALAIVLSPGTRHRAAATVIGFADSVLYFLIALRAFWLLVIVLAVQCLRRRIALKQFITDNRLWLGIMAVMVVFNFAVGIYSNRQLFGIELCSLVVMLRAVRGKIAVAWAVAAVVLAVAFVAVQFRGIRSVKQQYHEIVSQAAQKGGGAVYYDRTLGLPDPVSHQFRYYEEIVGPANNDTHHSLQKLLRQRFPKFKTVHVRPAYIKDVKVIGDTVISYAPGQFAVFLTYRGNRAMRLYGHRLIGGEVRDLQADTARQAVHGKGWRAYLVMAPAPFVTVDSVKLER